MKLIYLFERLLGHETTMQTPTAKLEWFNWCLNNNVDPELKTKKENQNG